MSRRIVALLLLLAATFTCVGLAVAEGRASNRAADSPGYWGFDTANLDKTCKPCDDFFQFAMGGWMKNNPIPPEYSTWGSFTVLADKNQQALRQILEASEKTECPPVPTRKRLETTTLAVWTPPPSTLREPSPLIPCCSASRK